MSSIIQNLKLILLTKNNSKYDPLAIASCCRSCKAPRCLQLQEVQNWEDDKSVDKRDSACNPTKLLRVMKKANVRLSFPPSLGVQQATTRQWKLLSNVSLNFKKTTIGSLVLRHSFLFFFFPVQYCGHSVTYSVTVKISWSDRS